MTEASQATETSQALNALTNGRVSGEGCPPLARHVFTGGFCRTALYSSRLLRLLDLRELSWPVS